ncbi:MAG: hypothetical protein ACI9ND_001643 [Yoonia sp.]|jgi:hypothetical protein
MFPENGNMVCGIYEGCDLAQMIELQNLKTLKLRVLSLLGDRWVR